MIKLLKYILVLCSVAFIISFGSFSFLNHGLRKQKNDSFGVINELLQSYANHQIVFVGSSLTKNNINPLVFDSIDGVDSYNFGFNGAKINHSEMIIKRYFNSNHPLPNTVILVMEPYILDSISKINFPIQYYPYYKDSIIYNYVSKYDDEIKWIRMFPFIGITKYNDYLKSLGVNGMLFPNRVTLGLIKGFEPLQGSHIAEVEKVANDKESKVNSNFSQSIDGINCFDHICVMCIQKGVKLTVVIPPTYLSNKVKKKYNVASFVELLNTFVKKYNIKVIDHTSLDLCFKGDYFYDGHHLNAKGADVYSRILATSINEH